MAYQLYLRAETRGSVSNVNVSTSGVFETTLPYGVGDTIDFGGAYYRATAIRSGQLGITIVDCEPASPRNL
jgi:hypothetical protein